MSLLINYKWRFLLLFLLICFLVEIVGGWMTQTSVNSWYPTLQKPAWNPPNWLFGPVWTVLYGLMAVSIWLIWLKHQESTSDKHFFPAYLLFGIQLFLNCLWSGLFFYMRNPEWAFVGIILLWIAILLTMIEFKKHSFLAMLLFLPYFIWTTYAVTLNAAIWYLNR